MRIATINSPHPPRPPSSHHLSCINFFVKLLYFPPVFFNSSAGVCLLKFTPSPSLPECWVSSCISQSSAEPIISRDPLEPQDCYPFLPLTPHPLPQLELTTPPHHRFLRATSVRSSFIIVI